MSPRNGHALVLGGSMAGLLAARILSEHFREVTIVERDAVLPDATPRRGVPQGRFPHGLLASGQLALEAMFPGFREGARARGGMLRDIGDAGAWHVGGVFALRVHSGVQGLLLSRPALEAYVCERVLARGNVSLRTGQVARALVGDARRVTGARLIDREQQTSEHTLCADLVVDASGRGSQLPKWLAQLGAATPREQCVRADVVYTGCTLPRTPASLDGDSGFIITPTAPARRGVTVLAIEDDRFIIALSGYLGEPGPRDYAGMIEYARSLPSPVAYRLLCESEPLTEPVQMRDPESRWRRYDRLSSFPEGLLVCGDALCSFNPAYAQGMTVAALEARALDACLARGQKRLAARFFREAARIVAVPWAIAVVADFAFDGVSGVRPFGTALMNSFAARLNRAAGRDPEVALARLQVTHLLAPPSSLLTPRILARVLRFGGASERTSALSVPRADLEP